MEWLINGQPGGTIPADDRGLAYGDGLFETVAIRDGRPRLLESHLERLASGCRRLGLPQPPVAALREELAALARGCGRGTGKIILTRGPGPRGYAPPPDPAPTRLVGCAPAPPADRSTGRDGVRVRSCAARWSENPLLAGLKTLNRLEQVMARAEWTDPGIAEGLMLGPAGNLVSGTMSNLFLALDGELVTPALQRAGIHGIMRAIVIREAAQLGMPVREGVVLPADLARADECFLTNSLIGLWPVTSWDARSFPVGPRTRALRARLAELGIEECG